MNILTIGGSGFVSGTLARLAVAKGHQVWSVTRGRRPMPEGVTPIEVDRADRRAFAKAIGALDVRFDLAVDCIGYAPEDAEQDVAVLPAVARHLVFISTDFVYDPARRTFPQRVDNPHFETQRPYGRGKRACETVLHRADTGDMTWTILRPCHIYGPGSQLGCLPLHGRDPNLLATLRAGDPITLVGGGHFLQQPIYAPDLARLILSCAGNAMAIGRTFHAAGPDIITSRRYYEIIAEVLGVDLTIRETLVDAHLAEHPEHAPFCCHRVYDLAGLTDAALATPATPITDGLREHVQSCKSVSN